MPFTYCSEMHARKKNSKTSNFKLSRPIFFTLEKKDLQESIYYFRIV